YVGVTDAPNEMFGKIMSIPDSLMPNYYTLLTPIPADEIAATCDAARTHPREAKARLARTIVGQYYDEPIAKKESDLFDRVCRDGGLRDDIPNAVLSASDLDAGQIPLAKLLKVTGLAPSTSEARRLIDGGGVSLNGQRVDDPQARVSPQNGMLVRVGKRKAIR